MDTVFLLPFSVAFLSTTFVSIDDTFVATTPPPFPPYVVVVCILIPVTCVIAFASCGVHLMPCFEFSTFSTLDALYIRILFAPSFDLISSIILLVTVHQRMSSM